MNVATVVMSLVITMIYPDGGWEQEKRPVEVAVCATNSDGIRVEDESCGLRACLKVGRERAAVLWGRMPGLNFHIMCFDDNGNAAQEGTGAGGGHPALGFEPEGGKQDDNNK